MHHEIQDKLIKDGKQIESEIKCRLKLFTTLKQEEVDKQINALELDVKTLKDVVSTKEATIKQQTQQLKEQKDKIEALTKTIQQIHELTNLK